MIYYRPRRFTSRFDMKLTKEEKELLKLQAKNNHMTPSELVRSWINSYY